MKIFSKSLLLISALLLVGCVAKKSTVEKLNTDLVTLASEVKSGSEKLMSLEENNKNLTETNMVLSSEISTLKKEIDDIRNSANEALRRVKLPDGAGTGDFAVHLASYRDVEQVVDGWETLKKKYPDILGALEGISSEFEIPNGGKFLRIKTGPFISEETAQAVCDRLETFEQYCMVISFEGVKLPEPGEE